MTKSQCPSKGLDPVLAMVALFLLPPSLVNGLHCPLPVSNSGITQYVSLCAMCSHNEAAVRWNRTVGDHLSYRNFYMRYECFDSEGNVVIQEDRSEDDEEDCPWTGTIYPARSETLVDNNHPFGIASAGRELSNGTTCNFKLKYRMSVGNGNVQYAEKLSSCTVGVGCEGEECSIDRVCTFSNGTQGVEEGLCTECSCSEGYSGPACANINECAGRNACDDNADCFDSDGSYWCQCLPGFQGDGYNCTDIDECENVTCGENAECLNTEGSYSCGCKSGFTGDGYNCTNINECAGNSTCDDSADCVDSDGSYWCQCLPGFQGDGYNCTDIDECQNVTCGQNAKCRNTVGNYKCQCDSGFTGDGYNCSNINECVGSNECDDNAACHDSVGSYLCQCLPGFQGDGHSCADINECKNVTCGENAECLNTEGSYSCGCKSGFTGDGYNCTNINECHNVSCGENATCTDEVGNYSCECDSGFTGDGYNCTDIEECHNGSIQCPKGSHCYNLPGSYECKCEAGLFMDGDTCTEPTDPVDPVTIVAIAVSALVFTLIVILLPIVLCLRILRPKDITFDDLTVKEINPFYSPKLRGQSIMSIHSEYEYLCTLTPSHSTDEPIEQLLENGTVKENEKDPVVSSHHLNEDLKMVLPLDKDKLHDSFRASSCVSGNNDSLPCPYIDEESLGGRGTVDIPQRFKNEVHNTSENSTVSPVGPLNNDSCSTESSLSTSKQLDSSGSHMVLSSGYVKDSSEPRQNLVMESAAKWEEMEDEGERGEKGARGEVEDQDGSKISDLTGGYVFSGIEIEQESLSNSGQVHIFTTGGGDITECTNVDDESSVDPNCIHGSLYHAHITQSDHPHISL